MTTGSSEIQSGFINALTMGTKVLTPGSTPSLDTLRQALSPVITGVSLNQAAIVLGGLAVAGTADALYQGYQAIQQNYNTELDHNEVYKENCERNVACFSLPEKKLSSSQVFFKAFIDLLQAGQQENGLLFRLANIHYTVASKTNPDPDKSYAIMNMASFSFVTQAHYAEGENEILDHARNGMDDFLQVLPQRLLRTLATRKTHSISGTFVTGQLLSKEIRHLNLVRFLVMTFVNIALNLKYPPDLATPDNVPLNDRAANALCATVTELIDQLLQPEIGDSKFRYIERLTCKTEFLEFLHYLKKRIQKLQEGYRAKLLHELNIGAVVLASREFLKSVNESITHTLFMGQRDATNANLLCLVEELASDFERLPNLWTIIQSAYKTRQLPIMPLGLNNPPQTVIDLIGFFASYDAAGRGLLLAHLKKAAPALATSLGRLDLYFIAPFDPHFAQVNKQATPSKHTPDRKKSSVFQHNATTDYLMSLIALVVESSPRVLEDSAYQQLVAFNQLQSCDANPALFSLSVFDDLKFQLETLQKIKTLVKNEHRFIDGLRTEIVLEKLLKSNKNLLMDARVRATAKKAGMTLAETSQAWWESVQALSQYINNGHDSTTDENRRMYFAYMLHESKGLTHHFDLLRLLIEDTIRVLGSAEFTHALAGEMKRDVVGIYASHDDFQSDRAYIMGLLMATWSKANSPGMPLGTAGVATNRSLTSAVLLRISDIGQQSSDTHSEDKGTVLGDSSQLHVAVSRTPPNSLEETPSEHSPALMLQTLCFILKIVSAFLLIVGVIVLLSLTLGVPYLPIITALTTTSQPATGFTLAACVSVATGATGLAVSYFFKPNAGQSEEDLDAEPEECSSCLTRCWA